MTRREISLASSTTHSNRARKTKTAHLPEDPFSLVNRYDGRSRAKKCLFPASSLAFSHAFPRTGLVVFRSFLSRCFPWDPFLPVCAVSYCIFCPRATARDARPGDSKYGFESVRVHAPDSSGRIEQSAAVCELQRGRSLLLRRPARSAGRSLPRLPQPQTQHAAHTHRAPAENSSREHRRGGSHGDATRDGRRL